MNKLLKVASATAVAAAMLSPAVPVLTVPAMADASQCGIHLYYVNHPDICKGDFTPFAGQNDGDLAGPGGGGAGPVFMSWDHKDGKHHWGKHHGKKHHWGKHHGKKHHWKKHHRRGRHHNDN